ncbi:transcriptional regulator [Sporanaerobium hydrogeniformans]|uniref:Transcriptional regulator n=1 Tax=Sporanaerobium hydrogeniformans TaxID=3072179 RepID=A0AC61DE97_9FIRM|nr:LacI family DNA-binding transcriptional regulator [Sporanaerobium hydrogeniformans]PHV71200.1 transcriptional regulator [Sporanaerobium hydrogeniformans]
MAKRVTMGDIAKVLDVSIVTVSKALSNKEGVSDEVRERIIKKAQEMGYVYNGSIKQVEKLESYTVGILVHEKFMDLLGNSFYWKIYQSISRILKEYNCFGILELIDETCEHTSKMSKLITENKVDGIILLGQMADHYIETLYSSNQSTILLDFYNENPSYDTIISDSFYGSYMLTNHLIANGHQEIAYVGDIHATSSILDRYLGYCKALIEHNLLLKDEYVLNDRDREGKFIDISLPKKLPTAFVCNCDEVAYILINKLKSEGYSIPEDISVVGFDNYLISTLMDPPLTTVQVNIEEMAKAAVKAILRKIKGKGNGVERRVINNNIIYRGSVKNIK